MTKQKDQRTSLSQWGKVVEDKDRLIKQAEHALALHRKNRATAERNGRCHWMPERGGWRCTADANSEHQHRYNEDELPLGWKRGD